MTALRVDSAIQALLEALVAEGVRPIESGLLELAGLTQDQQLLIAALDLMVPAAREVETKTSDEIPLPDVNSNFPTKSIEQPAHVIHDLPAQSPETAVGANKLMEIDEGRLAIITEDEMSAASEPTLIGASQASQNEPFVTDQPAQNVETSDATSNTNSCEVAEPDGAAAPSEAVLLEGQDGLDQNLADNHFVNPTVVESLVEVPQPGGVPMMPARATTQGDAAMTAIETIKKTIYLKNAKVNEPYLGVIEVPGLKGIRLLDDGGTGLKLDEEAGTLSGQPTVSGDFVIRVHGLLSNRRCDVRANLAVIPDPRSLWISKPHDPTAPFAKDDEDSEMNRGGDLVCVAASKRGRSHAREALFRDDDFALWTGGVDGWTIAVVADGAGSAKYSRRGSQIAVKVIVRDLPRLLNEHLTGQIDGLVAEHLKGVEGSEALIKNQLYLSLANAAFNAAMAINEEATKIGERESAFSTTLVLSVARRGPHGWFIAGFSIGDGGAAVFDLPSRTVFPLTLADSGEFAGQTRFLLRGEFNNAEEVAKRLSFNVRDSFTAVLAMTDGITDPKFPTDNAFASSDVWCSFWETDLSQSVLLSRDNPAIERELMAWLDFWSPGNHDDRTIAIMLP